jgi:hypothetical protein
LGLKGFGSGCGNIGLEYFAQTDAAIASLVDLNMAILTQSFRSNGIGPAILIDSLTLLAEQSRTGKRSFGCSSAKVIDKPV